MESFRELSFGDLREANENRQVAWEGSATMTEEFLGNALAGEVGEACNIVKKLARKRLGILGTGNVTATDLAKELADVVIYADLLAKHFNIDLGAAVISKFNEVSERYGLGPKL